MLFILLARTREPSDACLPDRSIGVSPPRLLHGRAANYGSIIIPAGCHRRDRRLNGLLRIGPVARPVGVMAHLRKRLEYHPTAGTYLMADYSVFKKQSGRICPSTSLLLNFFAFWAIVTKI